MPSFNVLITTIGRSNLGSLLDSLKNQLSHNDYITIVSDKDHASSQKILQSRLPELKCTVIYIANAVCLGYWGHPSRTMYQNKLLGQYILNADDDSVYLDGVFDYMREVVKEYKLYIFKHENQLGVTFWLRKDEVAIGNIDTACGVIPNTGQLPTWHSFYGGDGRFYENLAKEMQVEFVNYKISKYQS